MWKRVLICSIVGIAGVAFLFCKTAPRLQINREYAGRTKCASNLNQIGQAVFLYGNANQGRLPPDLPALLLQGNITPAELICVDGTFDQAMAPTTQQQATEILDGDHLGYVWAAHGVKSLADLQADVVVAFDFEQHVVDAKHKGINVLFGDGHVEFIDDKDAKTIWAQHIAGVRPVCIPAKPSTTSSK